MNHQRSVLRQRKRRGYRVRNRVKRDASRPRLSIFRSHKHIYAQVIDDGQGRTLCAASSTAGDVQGYGGNQDAAKALGKVIAERALAAGVQRVAFDRREYKYHGRVAAFAEGAREAGLQF